MTLRLIHRASFPAGSAAPLMVAKVYRDAEWQEYRVRFYKDGTNHLRDADYHTDDREDAISTAENAIKPRT